MKLDFFRQIKVSIGIIMSLLGVKYSTCILICDVDYYGFAEKLRYALYKVNDVSSLSGNISLVNYTRKPYCIFF